MRQEGRHGLLGHWVFGTAQRRATGPMGIRNGPAGPVIISLCAALRISTQLGFPRLVQTSASPEKDSHRTTAALKMNNPATLGPSSPFPCFWKPGLFRLPAGLSFQACQMNGNIEVGGLHEVHSWVRCSTIPLSLCPVVGRVSEGFSVFFTFGSDTSTVLRSEKRRHQALLPHSS